MATPKIEQVEKKIDHVFKRKDILRKALTHSSHAYEHGRGAVEDNELLEFLGDSVIGLIAAEFYYHALPDRTEGELSKMKSSATSTLALSRMAEKFKLEKHILLGKGEDKSGGRGKKTILAGAFEALLGAVFLDAGLEAARAVMTPLLSPTLKPFRKESFHINNCKSALQEMFQKAGCPTPTYRLVTEKGPAHSKTFVVEVLTGGKSLAIARGPSKKAAEQKAAQKALKSFLGRRMKVLSPEVFIVEDG